MAVVVNPGLDRSVWNGLKAITSYTTPSPGTEANQQLAEDLNEFYCSHNNLELNTLKTVEMTVDFRRNPPALPSLTIMDSTLPAVESFKFLGTTISQDLKWGILQGVIPGDTKIDL
ncbi:hypothetical protein QTP70_033178, partial [Hemibagrus guttatus]